jgi:L-alanine-DL-glutamate epimerase-like enolase superfamily enzyme
MKLGRIDCAVYRIPTDRPEADGTFEWSSTTLVLVEVHAGGLTGLGFTYAAPAAAEVVADVLDPVLRDIPLEDVPRCWNAMVHAVRNVGRGGVAATAISAVDVALWDLKARSQRRPLFQALGAARDSVPIYGSGGFTTYSERELIDQLGGWVEQGINRVKMKIGKDWGACACEDVARVQALRRALGPGPEIFVDANGAYIPKQALDVARQMADQGVTYFEEPVSSDHLDQLALIRRQATMDIAAGEYGYDPWYYRDMLSAEAVDVVQADVTRCLGITGWLQAAAVANAFAIPFSAHCAPTATMHAACAVPQISHLEYFWDHVRIDGLIFDGAPSPVGGCLHPDASRPGLGVELKRADAEQWRIPLGG